VTDSADTNKTVLSLFKTCIVKKDHCHFTSETILTNVYHELKNSFAVEINQKSPATVPLIEIFYSQGLLWPVGSKKSCAM
jgi:hypothetical protein